MYHIGIKFVKWFWRKYSKTWKNVFEVRITNPIEFWPVSHMVSLCGLCHTVKRSSLLWAFVYGSYDPISIVIRSVVSETSWSVSIWYLAFNIFNRLKQNYNWGQWLQRGVTTCVCDGSTCSVHGPWQLLAKAASHRRTSSHPINHVVGGTGK